ncbi:hypothetical protein KC316_g10498 [Hortaea werneckii]|nr:hypothetical protein KC324_g10418 [Hortaea werneckii]KAI7576902.1 hypothetical protein KC316_g10498 [Hortaea werneckii]
MAPTKESLKVNRKRPGQDAAVLKNTGATKKVTKRLSKNVRPVGRDLFTTLPAELRNEIYELTLVEEKIVVVGSVKYQRPPEYPGDRDDISQVANARLAKLRGGAFSEKGSLALRLMPWTESGVLQVCHSVRKEASRMYYGSNKFIARARLIDFGKLGAWLKMLCRRFGPQPLAELRISVMSASWLGLHNAIDLARAIHSSGIVLQPLDSQVWASTRDLTEKNPVIQLYKTTQYRIEEPLNEGLNISHQANSQGRSKSWLTRRLNVWLQKTLKPYRVQAAMNKMKVTVFEGDAFVGVKMLRKKGRMNLDERASAAWKEYSDNRAREQTAPFNEDDLFYDDAFGEEELSKEGDHFKKVKKEEEEEYDFFRWGKHVRSCHEAQS